MQTEAPAAEPDDIDVENVVEGERAVELQICRVCHQQHPPEEFIRCTECQHSFHRLKCVTPAVYENMDDWRCGDRSGIDTRLPAAADFTEDQAMMSHLQSGKFPEEADRKEQNRIRKRALNFKIRAGKLFKRKDQSVGERPVPAIQERLPIVAKMHQMGHPGVDKLRAMVNQQYYWPGIGALAKPVKDNCADCQRASKETGIPQGVKPIPVYGVLQRWHVHLMGPFPTTVNGNKYGIVAIDSVSKWPEAGALPNSRLSQTLVLGVLGSQRLANITCQYGTPQEVITDNGSEFKGEFGLMLQRCDITHLHTSPHHPHANGLERMIQTIKSSM